jgi:transposase, IS6 family
VRRALVPSLLALAPRCGRAVRRARAGGGSHDDLALGATLRSGAETTAAPSPPADQQILAGRRDLYSGAGPCVGTYTGPSDSTGTTIDFLLSALRDAAAAKRLFRQALSDPSHPQPRVINTDKGRLYSSAIAGMKAEGTLRRRCRHRPVQYLNNILEQDHRAIKRRVQAKQSFREFRAARRTLAGYEALHMIRKGQARWVTEDNVRQQKRFIDQLFELAA